MRASRTGATDLQPADARYPGRPLRLEQGRHGEQAEGESKNRHHDPHTRPIHLHGMAPRRAAPLDAPEDLPKEGPGQATLASWSRFSAVSTRARSGAAASDGQRSYALSAY